MHVILEVDGSSCRIANSTWLPHREQDEVVLIRGKVLSALSSVSVPPTQNGERSEQYLCIFSEDGHIFATFNCVLYYELKRTSTDVATASDMSETSGMLEKKINIM